MSNKTGARNLIAGIAGKSWDELCTRAWQETAKRWDATRYHLGSPYVGSKLFSGTLERQHFFVEPKDLPMLIVLLKQRLPQQVNECVERAERICRHEFDLLGYERLALGAEIDWHRDIVHDRRAPLKPWFQIRYLNFQEVGDAKITWELSRHQHLTTLARAYLFTGDQRFADETFRQWYDWWQQNPYPIGINWASSLEVAFRSLSWLWVRHLFEGCPTAPKSFRIDSLRALGINGGHIERYLSTYFSPNTHLLGEGVALFFIGTLCPQLSAANRWQHLGWRIICREAGRQVQADGMHFEQSTYYHVYALDFFLHVRMLAAANQIPIPSSIDQTLQKMLELLCGLSQSGVPPRMGDDDGGRVFDSQRNRAHHLLDPLATGAVLFDRGEFKAAASLSEETVWLLGREGVEKFDQLPIALPAHSSIGFETSGIYVMAGSSPIRQQAIIDAGRLGTGTGGHGHADALSLCLAVNGREWLVDPGTFAYISDGTERDLFRGTAAHNTMRVDGVDQAEPSGPFAWRAQPEVTVESWVAAESFDLLVASHTGYNRLRCPVVHRRCVFYLKSRFWLVIDLAEGKGVHNLEVSWHLAPGSVARTNTPNLVYFEAEDESALGLLMVEGHNWVQEIRDGWWSPSYGNRVPCPVLHFGTEAQLPEEFATLLLPASEGCTSLDRLTRIKSEDGPRSVHGYLYNGPHESHYIFYSGHGSRWESGPWVSDASFLYCGITPQGRLRHLAVCGGSFVEWNRRRVFTSRHPVVSFEWQRGGTAKRISHSEEDALHPNGAVVLTSDQSGDPEQGPS